MVEQTGEYRQDREHDRIVRLTRFQQLLTRLPSIVESRFPYTAHQLRASVHSLFAKH